MGSGQARRSGYKDRRAPDPAARGLGVERRATEERWDRRRTAAIAVRVAMALLSRVLPMPSAHGGLPSRIAWWVALLAGSLAAMWLVDRATRRLAPLAAMLDMAVLFPGRAPTRLAVARRAGDVRHLQALIQQSAGDVQSELAEAAEEILALVGSLRAHDRHTRGHSERVRVYTDLIAAELRLPPAAVDRLRWAALLHDIGKLRVPTSTLNKPAKLSAPEWETIRQHPLAGADLAAALLPWLGEWGKAIAEHHERFDGTGYPLGLAGRDISLAGRIVAVADSFEVMTASRSYKKAMTRATALEEVVRFSGTQFDPEVVRALLAVSAPRLSWAMGPTSWLVGTPLLGSAPSLTAAGVAAQAAVGASVVAVAGVTGLAGPVAAAASTSTIVSPSASPAASPAAPSSPPATSLRSHQPTGIRPHANATTPLHATQPPAPAVINQPPPGGPGKSDNAAPSKKAPPTPSANPAKSSPAAPPGQTKKPLPPAPSSPAPPATVGKTKSKQIPPGQIGKYNEVLPSRIGKIK